VIALAARENSEAFLLPTFEMKLARELYCGFGGFRPPRSEINAAAVSEIRRSHREQAPCEFFRRSGVKLRGVREGDLRRLLGHGATDFRDTVADIDDGSLPGSVQEAASIGCDNPATFSTGRSGKRFLKVAGKESTAHRHERSGQGL
jgi:hypothetical protein